MKRGLSLLLLFLALIIAFVAGHRFNQHQASHTSSENAERQILYYVDPMNPAHTSKEPGIAPCGMPMEPVYADQGQQAGLAAGKDFVPGTIIVDQRRQQKIGVRLGEVATTREIQMIRALGRITPNENKVHTLVSATEGWLGVIHESTTGGLVAKDQLLAHINIYNADFFAQQLRYLSDFRTYGAAAISPHQQMYNQPRRRISLAGPPESTKTMPDTPSGAHDHRDHQEHAPPMAAPPVATEMHAPDGDADMGKDHDREEKGRIYFNYNSLANRGSQDLLAQGVGKAQLKALSRSGVLFSHVELRSPVKGIVLSRSVTPLQRVERGTECFRVAELDSVWVETNIYDVEAEAITAGMIAQVTKPRQGEHFKAVVSEVPARFDASSRTFKVRLEMDNPNLFFRPDMVVDVTFRIPRPAALTVPVGAVIDTGKRTVVYVQTAEGVFTPRPVVLGWRGSERVEVVSGLQEGEKIAISGTFLLDSESRMKLAAAGLMTDSASPVQPSPQPPQPAGHEGHTHPQQPQNQPAQPAMPMQPAVTKTIDPVCGMKVNPDTARVVGLFAEAEGTTYFFCSEECRELFKQDPLRYIKAPQTPPAGHEGHDHAQQQPSAPTSPPSHSTTTMQPAAAKAIDPVCGMKVNPDSAREAGLFAEAEGTTYFFCSEECRELFKQDPLRYLKAPQTPPAGHEGHGHAQPHH